MSALNLPSCALTPTLPLICFFFFNDPATTEIYTLSLHDALPISLRHLQVLEPARVGRAQRGLDDGGARSEEHTSELQSPVHLVCRLLLEKKKNDRDISATATPNPSPGCIQHHFSSLEVGGLPTYA